MIRLNFPSCKGCKNVEDCWDMSNVYCAFICSYFHLSFIWKAYYGGGSIDINKSKEEVLASIALLKIKYPALINVNIWIEE